MTDVETTVAVVGAGPVGMVAAAALAARGVAVVVLDRSAGLRGEGSKAICVQREPLETLHRLGAAAPLLERGVSWTVGRTFYRDTELLRVELPTTGPDALPPFVNISQHEVERALLQRLAELPDVDMRWSQRVVGLAQDPAGVTLHVAAGEREVPLRCRYVVAADGARSTVRDLVSVGFPGHSHDDEFLIADIHAELGFPSERRFFFDPPYNRGRQVLIHPQPDSVWRIDWQVPPGVDADEEKQSGRMDERIRSVIGEVPYELRWLSTYRFHQRCADRFRVGRVFLAGDAAHLMSPFGARGMNSGIADAENLAWKLDLVLHGQAPERLLDTYEIERRAAAVENLRLTDATMRFLAPSSPWLRLRRDLLLRGAARLRPLRRWVDSGRLSTPHVYDASPIVDRVPWRADADGPPVGAVVPDAPCRVLDRPEVRRLREVLGDVVTGLYVASDAPAAQRFVADQRLEPSCPHRLCVVVPDGVGAAAEVSGDAMVVVDVQGAIRSAYGGPDVLYVVRPDLHLASRTQPPAAGDWAAAAARAVGAAVAIRADTRLGE